MCDRSEGYSDSPHRSQREGYCWLISQLTLAAEKLTGNASGTLIVQALKPLNLKKDSGLLTGLLTHKIVRERLEPDSRDLATVFY
jgi:hypothetical protein